MRMVVVFAVDAGVQPKQAKIQGAEFDVSGLWPAP